MLAMLATHCSQCFMCINLQQPQRVDGTPCYLQMRHFKRLRLDPGHTAGTCQSWGSDSDINLYNLCNQHFVLPHFTGQERD